MENKDIWFSGIDLDEKEQHDRLEEFLETVKKELSEELGNNIYNEKMALGSGSAILSITTGILGYFDKKAWRKRQQKWVLEIKEDLEIIKQQLVVVTDLLKQLLVKSTANWENYINSGLLGSVMVITEQNSEWRKSNDEFLASPLVKNQMWTLYSQLQTKSRSAMAGNYACFSALLISLRCELYLSELLDFQNQTVINTLDVYHSYFEKCIAEKVNDNITDSINKFQKEIDQLKTEYKDGDIIITERRRTSVRRRGEICDAVVSKRKKAIGTVDKGFTFKAVSNNVEYRNCREIRHSERGGRLKLTIFPMMSVGHSIQGYKNAQIRYKNVLEPNINSLLITYRQVKKIIELIKKLKENVINSES